MATKILVPLNRSQHSREILAYIEKLIPAQDTQLILFYITRPPKTIGLAAPDYRSDYVLEEGGEPVGEKLYPIYASQQEDSVRAEIEVALLPVTNDLKAQGYQVALNVCFDDGVVAEIVRTVNREKIDLLAMSTQAREGLMRFFFGDIANRVMRRVKVPVLLVHPEI